MVLTLSTRFSTVGNTTVLTPYTNSKEIHSSILPQRFGSISNPSYSPIVSPDLTSVSEPKLKKSKPQIKPETKEESEEK